MKAWFDEQVVPEFVSPVTGKVTPAKTVLFFHMEKPSHSGPGVAPETFDGPATEQHKKGFASQYAAFLKSKEVKTEE